MVGGLDGLGGGGFAATRSVAGSDSTIDGGIAYFKARASTARLAAVRRGGEKLPHFLDHRIRDRGVHTLSLVEFVFRPDRRALAVAHEPHQVPTDQIRLALLRFKRHQVGDGWMPDPYAGARLRRRLTPREVAVSHGAANSTAPETRKVTVACTL